MTLSDKFCLCYINTDDLFAWIKENELSEINFSKEREKWKKIIDKEPNFFSDTELLLIHQDIIVLKVADDNHATFLTKTYKLEYQNICQKVFQEKKNIVIISGGQWKEKKVGEKVIILFKDKENIEKSLSDWFAKNN